MIAVGLQLPIEENRGRSFAVRLTYQAPQARAGARADDLELSLFHPPDHVQIDVERHLRKGDCRPANPMPRAKKSSLLRVPAGEQNGPSGGSGKPLDRVEQLQQASHAAGIVIGAIVDIAERAEAVSCAAEA